MLVASCPKERPHFWFGLGPGTVMFMHAAPRGAVLTVKTAGFSARLRDQLPRGGVQPAQLMVLVSWSPNSSLGTILSQHLADAKCEQWWLQGSTGSPIHTLPTHPSPYAVHCTGTIDRERLDPLNGGNYWDLAQPHHTRGLIPLRRGCSSGSGRTGPQGAQLQGAGLLGACECERKGSMALSLLQVQGC